MNREPDNYNPPEYSPSGADSFMGILFMVLFISGIAMITGLAII